MRPMKPANLLEGHLGARERARRTREETALLTGTPMQPGENVRADPVALKEFRRIKRLLNQIGKDDSLYSAQINRYCLLYSECLALEDRRRKMEAAGDAAEKDADRITFYRLANDCSREIMSKRRMMGDIEKDNIMTISSALRSVPRKPEHVNPLLEVLKEN